MRYLLLSLGSAVVVNIAALALKSEVESFVIYAISVTLATLLEISLTLSDILEHLKKGK